MPDFAGEYKLRIRERTYETDDLAGIAVIDDALKLETKQ